MTLINDHPGMEVVAEAGSAATALEMAQRHRPDVILMDIRMPGESGLDATQRIVAAMPDMRIVILTSFADDELVARAIRAGAIGYVLKQVGNAELLRAIAAAGRGEAVLDAATTARLMARLREADRKSDQDAFRDLSERELDVLELIARGMSNGEIGAQLALAEKTVRNHVSDMLDKLHLGNRVELAVYAVRHHLDEKRERPGRDA